MNYFCTYFDHRYLPQGLALHKSLKQHCLSFKLWILCLDSTCYRILSALKLSDVHLIALEDFERNDEELLKAKQNRTTVEYYFTCTPSLPLFILNKHSEVDLITYLDADLFFFADPKPIFDEITDHSIAIIAHRFPPSLRSLERHGIYNVGWLSFKRDKSAFTCLQWWRERCNEWCYDRVEDGRFADQKYLDDWPVRFQNVVVLRHIGADLAPWNIANYQISAEGNHVWVDDVPLIFFHFHGFKQITRFIYDANLAKYGVKLSVFVRRNIYEAYIRALLDVTRRVSLLLPNAGLRDSLRGQVLQLPQNVSAPSRVIKKKLRWLLSLGKGLLAGKFLVIFKQEEDPRAAVL